MLQVGVGSLALVFRCYEDGVVSRRACRSLGEHGCRESLHLSECVCQLCLQVIECLLCLRHVLAVIAGIRDRGLDPGLPTFRQRRRPIRCPPR